MNCVDCKTQTSSYATLRCRACHYKNTIGKFRSNPIVRFFKYVKKSPTCWFWNGTKYSGGYGNFTLLGKHIQAHRFSYEIVNGLIPEGFYVCHKCDVRSCVNPKHLWLGTARDNSKDAFQKERVKLPHGQLHPLAKFTEKDVLFIRSKNVSKYGSQIALARQYNVTVRSIENILKRKTWKHI